MSKNTFFIMILLLIIFTLLYSTVGIGITTIIFAAVTLIQAIIFTIKPVYYNKFLKFVNPSIYNVYIKKGDVFIEKKRKINIIMQYILFFILIFDGFMQIKISRNLDIKQISVYDINENILIVVFTIILIVLTSYTSKFIMKKSKTLNKYNIVRNELFNFTIYN